MGSRSRRAQKPVEPTHVALLRGTTGKVQPATVQGRLLVGSALELRTAFGLRMVRAVPLSFHAAEYASTITVAEWLAW